MLKTALKASALAVATQIVEAEERTGRDKYRSLHSRSGSGGRSRSRDEYAYAEIFAATANGSEVWGWVQIFQPADSTYGGYS